MRTLRPPPNTGPAPISTWTATRWRRARRRWTIARPPCSPPSSAGPRRRGRFSTPAQALTSDTLGLPDHGELIEEPGAKVVGLSEEHGKVELPAGSKLKVGDRVRVLPDHICPVINLFDQVYLVSGDKVIDILPVAARGRLS